MIRRGGGPTGTQRLAVWGAVALAALVMSTGAASAGNFTFTTTPEEDAALAAHLDRMRADDSRRRVTTPQQHLENVLRGHLVTIQDQADEKAAKDAARAKRGKK